MSPCRTPISYRPPATRWARAYNWASVHLSTAPSGATKPHHLDDAVAAIDVELSPSEQAFLEESPAGALVAGAGHLALDCHLPLTTDAGPLSDGRIHGRCRPHLGLAASGSDPICRLTT